MSSPVARYETSGFFRSTSILLALAATVAGIALGWVYTLATRLIPIIQLNLLVTFSFGALLGGGLAWAIRKGHCRNRGLAVLLALPVALVPLASSYWFSYQSAVSMVRQIDPEQPFTLSDYLAMRQRSGWKISDHGHDPSSVDGWMVDVVWAGEALIVLGMVMFIALRAAQNPYCERCNEWGIHRALVIGGRGRGDVQPLLEKGDIDAVMALTRSPDADAVALTYAGTVCPSCSETGFLSIEELIVIKKGKKRNTKKTVLIKNVVLTPTQRAAFWARLPAAKQTISG